MTEIQQIVFLIDRYADLQRIKIAEDKEKEVDYQLQSIKTKLEVFGIETGTLNIG